MKHEHECVCGRRWSCILNILPLPDGLGGIRCERWEHNGICPTCLDSILSNGDQQAIVESMMTCGDPLLAIEAKKRLKALSL